MVKIGYIFAPITGLCHVRLQTPRESLLGMPNLNPTQIPSCSTTALISRQRRALLLCRLTSFDLGIVSRARGPEAGNRRRNNYPEIV